MNAINTAIYSTLTGDNTLTALLATNTSVYHVQAPRGATLPYIVFNMQAGTEVNETAHTVNDMLYQVRGFTDVSMKNAKAIDARIYTLLHKTAISITGYKLLKINRVTVLEFIEDEPNTQPVYSAGGIYRLRIEKTS
jgi:hypothetical protein